jgi:hypothetical protein
MSLEEQVILEMDGFFEKVHTKLDAIAKQREKINEELRKWLDARKA